MHYRLLAAGASLGIALALADAGEPDRIARLVRQLGGDSFIEREEARQALAAIGPPALATLRTAAKHGDLETTRRAADLVRVIEDKATRAALLAPKQLRLQLDRVPVLAAVAQLSQQSGYVVRVDGDRTVLGDKTVTLDRGPVTFWEALDQLSTQAGLVEKLTIASLPADTSPVDNHNDFRLPARRPSLILPAVSHQRVTPAATRNAQASQGVPGWLGSLYPAQTLPGRVILTPGSAAGRHASYAGAVRVVLRPAPPAASKELPSSGKAHDFLLDASAEPRLLGFTITGTPAITRAIDEHGQALAFTHGPPMPDPKDALPAEVPGFPGRAAKLAPPPAPAGIPVRLQSGRKPAKKLQVLAGTLTAQVLIPNSQLALIGDVLKAAGKVVDIHGGGRLQLDKIEKIDSPPTPEQYRAVVKLEGGSGAPEAAAWRGNRLIYVNAGQNVYPDLLDARGNRLRATRTSMVQESTADGQSFKLVVEMRYRRGAGQGVPTQLELAGTYTATIVVPFQFTDVPLP